MNGGTGNQLWVNILILIAFAGLVYFLLIRPQKKKEKQIKEMRSNISVGDEIVTIGGICGKVVKTKEDTLVIQVGADKSKFEMKKWSVSSVEKKGSQPSKGSDSSDIEVPASKPKPKRLTKKSSAESMEAELSETKSDNGDTKDTAE